jgi:predicted TIM-barrel fold metal-dependent hydrolase
LLMLPRIVEPHHHYVVAAEAFHEHLKRAGVPEYLPEHFKSQISPELQIDKAVHVECGPIDALAEAEWVEGVIASNATPCTAIVAACNLADDRAPDLLAQLKQKCPHIVGIRYCLDYAGPFGEAPATHFFVSRHGEGGSPFGGGKGVDFLRDPAYASKFETGFGALAALGLTFDLQCAPAQLEAAAALIGRHPGVRVVLDHLAKPRLGGDAATDAAELELWRRSMTVLAALPNVYVKLSMLAYAVPGWMADEAKEAQVAALVTETIEKFGPKRCMFSANWWANGALANSDGRDEVDVTMAALWQKYHSWVASKFSEEEVARLFAGTAEEFYGI